MNFGKPLAESTLAILRMECFAQSPQGHWVNRGGFIPFVDSLAPHFRRVEVVAPVVPGLEVPAGAETFQASNVCLRPLPNMQGLANCWRRTGQARRLLDGWSQDWDLVNLRAPDNFLPAAADYLRATHLPHYVQLVSHPLEVRESAIGSLSPALQPLGRRIWRRQLAAIRTVCEQRLCIAHGESTRQVAEDFGARAINLPSGSLWSRDIRRIPRKRRVKRLLFVGRINPEKGLHVLLGALARLPDLDLQLQLVGWPTGDLDQALKRQAESLGLGSRVSFHGPVPHGPELFRLYAQADLFVLPSVSEGTPRVIGEAMAFGLPVVSTTAGGIPDLVDHGRTGLLVPPQDEARLAEALRAVVSDRPLREALTRAASDQVQSRSLESAASAHVAALEQHAEHLAAAPRRHTLL